MHRPWVSLFVLCAACGGAPNARETAPAASTSSQDTASAEQQLLAIIRGPVDQARTPAAYFQLAMLRQQREYGPATQLRGPGDCTNPAMWSADEDPRALLRHVVQDFPSSEHVASALMLLVYLEKDRCHREAFLRAAFAIACTQLSADAFADGPFLLSAEGTTFASCVAHPRSESVIGAAWFEVGEALFEEAGMLPLAIEAYQHALEAPSLRSDARPVVQYKLAWCYYRVSHYDESLRAFLDLLDRFPQSELRAEAVQYMAIIIAYEDWNEDAQPDAHAGITRPEVAGILSSGNAVVPELLRQVAVAYSQETKYADAAATLDYLIAHFANAVTDEDRSRRARAAQGLP